ncbi:PSD1 and planctomycete cytochrome C domain-containing protein [Flavicella sediminum]|uniref:PSD1 and planctomycete cytochrome C domain-containing protein n=1 Tax=Flavicella sediminum TaxID=2585141 RepID=UPI001120E03F|nr:PSD1 and planctomycete cytochrome C domain-containing protein [Flavicella sediminum]
MKHFYYIFFVCIGISSCKETTNKYSKIPEKKVPEIVDYNFDVRPILSDKCFNCHGPDAKKRFADLRLDTQEGAYAVLKESPGKHGIIPHKPNESEIYNRIISTDTTQVMPPADSQLTLNDYEKKIIKKWIKQGAEYKTHWSFLPVEKPELPTIENKQLANNEIDYFILHKLKQLNLSPNEMADKERLLKRVSFDITGLPPSLEMQYKFLTDTSENAYEKIVDELLASKHYGEKMASSWLDVARYADSHGYQDDDLRTMWPWRDWVIHAFNENYGYDKFVTWQLAGDLLPNKNLESVLATGFNRNHKINQEGGIIVEEFRIETLTDRTNTFGKAFLGLTFECAKCHDHKYDPISQKEYFSTFAFFEKTPYRRHAGGVGKTLAEKPYLDISTQLIQDSLPFINKKSYENVRSMIMEERQEERQTHLLERGAYDAKGEIVTHDLPKSILAFDKSKFKPNRLGMSDWLFDKKNPLTSRVYVNRIWQEIFGVGIVKTSGDFGMQGDLPTHVNLLNWLSSDFMEHGWNIKRLVKQIVTSSTYKQSSVISEEKQAIDPDNNYLSRSSRLRYSSEMIRDHVLASSGLLNSEVGGRSVKVYQPEGMWKATSSGRGILSSYVQDHGSNLYKRGIYIFIKRTTLPPVQQFFDASTRDQCEVQRQSTMTPLQALIMLNDPTVLEAARVLAEKLILENNSSEKNIEVAFRKIVCRTIKPEEKTIFLDYYKKQEALFKKEQSRAEKFIDVGEYPSENIQETYKVAALMQIIHTMYNMEETIIKS